MISIAFIKPGMKFKARLELNTTKISNWKFGRDAILHSSGFPTGSLFEIIEVNTAPGAMWVRMENTNTWPIKYLKVTGEELSGNFELIND